MCGEWVAQLRVMPGCLERSCAMNESQANNGRFYWPISHVPMIFLCNQPQTHDNPNPVFRQSPFLVFCLIHISCKLSVMAVSMFH